MKVQQVAAFSYCSLFRMHGFFDGIYHGAAPLVRFLKWCMSFYEIPSINSGTLGILNFDMEMKFTNYMLTITLFPVVYESAGTFGECTFVNGTMLQNASKQSYVIPCHKKLFFISTYCSKWL